MPYDRNENEPSDSIPTAFVGDSMEQGDGSHVHGVAMKMPGETWIGLSRYDDVYQNAISEESKNDD